MRNEINTILDHVLSTFVCAVQLGESVVPIWLFRLPHNRPKINRKINEFHRLSSKLED